MPVAVLVLEGDGIDRVLFDAPFLLGIGLLVAERRLGPRVVRGAFQPWSITDADLHHLLRTLAMRRCHAVSASVSAAEHHDTLALGVDEALYRATSRPVRFELTEQTRQAVDDYLSESLRRPSERLFPGRSKQHCLTTRQYARLIFDWIGSIGLDPSLFGTHSLRRTKATLIYRRTGNLREVQLLLGHTKIESTVRYLGIEVDDALAISGQVDV